MNTNNNNPYRANGSGAQGAGEPGAARRARTGRGYERAAARQQAASGQTPQHAYQQQAGGVQGSARQAGSAQQTSQASYGQPQSQRTAYQQGAYQQGAYQQGAYQQGARTQNVYRQAGAQNVGAQNTQAYAQANAAQAAGRANASQGFSSARSAQNVGQAGYADQASGYAQAGNAGQAGATFGYSKASAQHFNAQTAAQGAGNAAANYGTNMKKKKGKRVWTIVMVVAAIVMVVALGVLGFIGYGYLHGTKVYDEIANTAGPVKDTDSLASMTVDWDTLRAQNEDIVGWIYMPGTSIDYPIVQGDDDNEYLQKDFTGDSSGIVHKGTIFLSTINSSDFSDQNNFIYGHNMNDETMFAHVLAMTNQSEFDAARTFYIYTPTMNYRCQTFAIDIVKNTDTQILQTTFSDASSMASYITARIQGSSVSSPTDIDVSSIKKMFTLITCGDDYATTRAVLVGSSVEEAVPANATSSATATAATADAAASEGAATENAAA